MANYDSRLKYIKDTDLFYWDAYAWTAVSAVSETVDLGAAQAYANIPVSIHWEFSADFSVPSSNGLAPPWQGIVLEDAADGSTFVSVMAVPLHSSGANGHNGASTVTATVINARNMGVVTIRRYSRLVIGYVGASLVTIKAWARMGLSD
jgi:hypothetical protein